MKRRLASVLMLAGLTFGTVGCDDLGFLGASLLPGFGGGFGGFGGGVIVEEVYNDPFLGGGYGYYEEDYYYDDGFGFGYYDDDYLEDYFDDLEDLFD